MAKDLSGAQAGMLQGSQVNDPATTTYKGKNHFPQTFMHPSTSRYGEVDAVCAMKCETGDIFPYRFITDLNTHTLKSPIKSSVNLYTAAFKVPMQAIYPRNWDIMLPIPNKGDDVPDNTRCAFYPGTFCSRIYSALNHSFSIDDLDKAIRCVFLLESVFSSGSLFTKFNIHLNAFTFHVNNKGDSISFDKYFDLHFIPWLEQVFVDGTNVKLVPGDVEDSTIEYVLSSDGKTHRLNAHLYAVPLRRLVELLRSGDYLLSTESTFEDFDSFPMPIIDDLEVEPLRSLKLNIESVISYQIACSHFFANSKIDSIYTAQLYRDNLQSVLYGANGRVPTFLWNGIQKQYDVFSEYIITDATQMLNNISAFYNAYAYFTNLFSFVRSMRFGDYFTSARTEPLAVGDINAPVVDGSVNSIEITKKLQLTRLLNKANISGPRYGDYLKRILGGSVPEAPKDVPIRLSLEQFNIQGFEVNNTGERQFSDNPDDQNIITTNLRLTDSKHLFVVNINEPCWIVVVQYYDVHRIYSKTTDRFAFHFDRYDDLIPDLQYVGDQDVNRSELDITLADYPFAYNLRYMEYKQRYSYASGGFIEFLPSWSMIADNGEGNPMPGHINSEFIRSSPTEFDRFYKSLTGYSLGSYFHFINFTINELDPYRQMVYAPEILA